MALADAVQGSRWPAQQVTWTLKGGGVANLSGAVLTGKIRNASGVTRAVAGAFTVTDGPAGVFVWQYAAEDVADAGIFKVQFTATWADGLTPGKTFIAPWIVAESLP
jgi:predicted MFS family arabinose efflux permease